MDGIGNGNVRVVEVGRPSNRAVEVTEGLVEGFWAFGNGMAHALRLSASGTSHLAHLYGTYLAEISSSWRPLGPYEATRRMLKGQAEELETLGRAASAIVDNLREEGIAAASLATGRVPRRFSGCEGGEAPSWQSATSNLALRATVKRSMNYEDLGFRLDGIVGRVRDPVSHLDGLRRRVVAMRRGMASGGRLCPRLPNEVHTCPADVGPSAEWFVPPGDGATSRTIVYLPGGAFLFPATSFHRLHVARLALATGARVLLVNYRLAYEHPFPAGLEDCVAAVRAVYASVAKPGSVAIAGDSAGGGLAVSTMLALRDAGDPLPGCALLASPFLDLARGGHSHKENVAVDPMFSFDHSDALSLLYLAGASPGSPLVSPVCADPSGLPPILSQVGSTEILLDDTLTLASNVEAAGGTMLAEVWHGMAHVWHLNATAPESARAVARMASFMGECMPAD
jgi:acetyl esterase/lipase